MADVVIAAKSRTEFGKGAARRIRRDGLVPAVLYGHGTDPIHVSLPGHEVLLALRVANALLTIVVDGKDEQLALPKQVQRDPITGALEHVDLVLVRKGEKVTVDVPLALHDKDRSGEVVLLDTNSISLLVEATHIPSEIVVDATALQVGESITAADLILPEGAALAGDPEELIVSVSTVAAEAAPVEGEEAAEGEAEATEGAE